VAELIVIALAIVTGSLVVAIWMQVDSRLGDLETWQEFERAMDAAGKKPPREEDN